MNRGELMGQQHRHVAEAHTLHNCGHEIIQPRGIAGAFDGIFPDAHVINDQPLRFGAINGGEKLIRDSVGGEIQRRNGQESERATTPHCFGQFSANRKGCRQMLQLSGIFPK